MTWLTIPNPSRRAGRTNKSRFRSLGGALPVQAGISRDLIVSFSGCSRANKSCSKSLGGASPVQAGISRDLIVSFSGCSREWMLIVSLQPHSVPCNSQVWADLIPDLIMCIPRVARVLGRNLRRGIIIRNRRLAAVLRSFFGAHEKVSCAPKNQSNTIASWYAIFLAFDLQSRRLLA